MKKADYILICFLALSSIIFFGLQVLSVADDNLAAIVQYGSERILVINLEEATESSIRVLKKPDPQYIIDEDTARVVLTKEKFPMLVADMTIEFWENKIRVEKEESPLKICSKQGWVTDSLVPIVCLPNKVTITVVKQSQVNSIIKVPPSIDM